jgi:hypothetical protein
MGGSLGAPNFSLPSSARRLFALIIAVAAARQAQRNRDCPSTRGGLLLGHADHYQEAMDICTTLNFNLNSITRQSRSNGALQLFECCDWLAIEFGNDIAC